VESRRKMGVMDTSGVRRWVGESVNKTVFDGPWGKKCNHKKEVGDVGFGKAGKKAMNDADIGKDTSQFHRKGKNKVGWVRERWKTRSPGWGGKQMGLEFQLSRQ